MTCCGGGCKPDQNFDPGREGPSEADIARFSGETLACAACGAEMYDEATVCQECGEAVNGEAKVKPWVVAIGVGLAVAMVVLMVM